jgi:hypothetical protein
LRRYPSQLSRGDLVIASTYSQGLQGCWLVYRIDINRLYNVGYRRVPGGWRSWFGEHRRTAAAGCTPRPAPFTNGDTASVTFGVTFKSGFEGTYNTILRAQEIDTWVWSAANDHGNLTITEDQRLRCETVSVSPANGTATNRTAFGIYVQAQQRCVRAEPVTWSLRQHTRRIERVLAYLPRSISRLYLMSDAGAYLAGAPGSANVVENSRCRLTAADNVTTNSNDVSVTFNVTFFPAFGSWNTILRAQGWGPGSGAPRNPATHGAVGYRVVSPHRCKRGPLPGSVEGRRDVRT